MDRRLLAPLFTAGAAVGVGVLLRVHDPHVAGSYGVCPFVALTGLWCPGCGGLRAVNHLTHGDVVTSLHSNALALPLILTAAVLWFRWFNASRREEPTPRLTLPTPLLVVTVTCVLAFGVLRNTPWGGWLTPV